jgi:hypothetical protein
MLLFNGIISHRDLIEVPLKNRAYTWSNIQVNCLLEKLDWVFTSSNWTVSFPNTMAYALSHATSNHVPYVTQMETIMPKSNLFRFENFWISFLDFFAYNGVFWSIPLHRDNVASLLSAKLKALHRGLKAWSKELSKLNKLINNKSYVLALLDV